MRLALLVLSLAAPLLSLAQAPSLLDAMRDRERPLLVFAGADDRRVETEYAELQLHARELKDRDMRIVLVTRSRTVGDDKTPAGTVAATAFEAQRLRSRFHVAPDRFTVVLLGKDGGEKFRATHVVTAQALCVLVDAMPMRRLEMQSR